MVKLTAEERKWLRKVQKALNECPSDRIGFYTIGDPQLVIYDRSKEEEIEAIMDSSHSDWCGCVREAEADFDEVLYFPAHVLSTAG